MSMQGQSTEVSFSFVNYDGPKLSRDPTVRRTIRRQAMRDVAADRKQQANYGQKNLRQYPVFLGKGLDKSGSVVRRHISPDCEISAGGVCRDQPGTDRFKSTVQLQNQRSQASGHHALLSPVSFPYSYLGMSETFYLLLNMTPLTGLRLGTAKFDHLKRGPARAENVCSMPNLGSRRLLYFIPSRYGQVNCLRLATDCVVAKLRQLVEPPKGGTADRNAVVLEHYTKALRALQIALDDQVERMAPETLCATELLGIFELLEENSEAHSWLQHAGGAARLIESRGPSRFNTEFEMSLFMANIGPTVMDAFLNNKPCFLAEKQWRQVMFSAICSDELLSEQKDLVLSLWGHLVDGPRKFKETTDIIVVSKLTPQCVIDDLIGCLLDDRNSLLCWMEMAQKRTGPGDLRLEQRPCGAHFPWPAFDCGLLDSRQATQLALWGTSVMCFILKSRLLFALSPVRFRLMEEECQRLAAGITGLTQDSISEKRQSPIENLFTSQSSWIVQGIISTKHIWGESREEEGTIEKWKFEAWCRAIGRQGF